MEIKTIQIWLQLPLLIVAYYISTRPGLKANRVLRGVLIGGFSINLLLCLWVVLAEHHIL
jgi:hypothetical protein